MKVKKLISLTEQEVAIGFNPGYVAGETCARTDLTEQQKDEVRAANIDRFSKWMERRLTEAYELGAKHQRKLSA